MNKKILGLTLAIGSLAMSSGTQASVIIDSFSNDSDFLVIVDNLPAVVTTTTSLPINGFSDSRVLTLGVAGPGGGSAVVTSDLLIVSAGFSTTTDTTSAYSNTTGFDFTASEAGGTIFDTFVFQLLSIDQGGVDITLTVNGISALQTATAPGAVFFAHALFGNVTAVNSLVLLIQNNTAVDAAFDSLTSYGSRLIPAVPEPAFLALLAAGLTAFGFGRRKAK